MIIFCVLTVNSTRQINMSGFAFVQVCSLYGNEKQLETTCWFHGKTYAGYKYYSYYFVVWQVTRTYRTRMPDWSSWKGQWGSAGEQLSLMSAPLSSSPGRVVVDSAQGWPAPNKRLHHVKIFLWNLTDIKSYEYTTLRLVIQDSILYYSFNASMIHLKCLIML